MKILSLILLFVCTTLPGQYIVKHNGLPVKVPGGSGSVQHSAKNTNPPPVQDTWTVYWSENFDDNDLGQYDSIPQYADFPTMWDKGNSWETDSHDSVYIEWEKYTETDSSKCMMVYYFEGNKGTYPDTTCNNWQGAPPNFPVDGSGETFAFYVTDSVDTGYESDPIGIAGNIKWSDFGEFRQGGKSFFTIRLGDEFTYAGGQRDSCDGFSHLLTFDNISGSDSCWCVCSFIYYQYEPYHWESVYATTFPWNEIDGVEGDSAIITRGEWHNIFVYLQPNTFDEYGDANADGIITGWMDGKMYFRKSDVMFIHGAFEHQNGYAAEWYDSEAAFFYGGCNTGHVTQQDNCWWFDDYHLGRPSGPNFPEGDTVDRNYEIAFPELNMKTPD